MRRVNSAELIVGLDKEKEKYRREAREQAKNSRRGDRVYPPPDPSLPGKFAGERLQQRQREVAEQNVYSSRITRHPRPLAAAA